MKFKFHLHYHHYEKEALVNFAKLLCVRYLARCNVMDYRALFQGWVFYKNKEFLSQRLETNYPPKGTHKSDNRKNNLCFSLKFLKPFKKNICLNEKTILKNTKWWKLFLNISFGNNVKYSPMPCLEELYTFNVKWTLMRNCHK